MATATFLNSFEFDWPPETLEGGTISTRTTTQMTYVSDLGYTVTIRGTGFTYDDDGFPASGSVTRLTVKFGATTYADFTGLSAELQRVAMAAFGWDRGPTQPATNPDGYALVQHLLRGNDLITGSAFDDDLIGGIGNDTVNAGDGFDFITADAGNDQINGGADRDWLSFDESYWDYTAFQGVVVDNSTGAATDCWGGQDTITGIERFRDSVFSDSFTGSAIDEIFSITRGNDTVVGGGGFDQVRYDQAIRWGATRGVNVNLSTGVARDSWRGTDSISGVEGVVGSSFNDTITGDANDNYLMGGQGIDVINGGLGIDRLAFWAAEDYASGTGIVINMNMAGAIIQNDGLGNIENATGIEEFEGTSFADSFTGNAAANTFIGEDGDDTLIGNAGNDTLIGGWSNDSLSGGTYNDDLWGDQGDDTMAGGTGADHFGLWFGDLPNAGVDHITDFAAADRIWVDTGGMFGLGSGPLAGTAFLSAAGAVAATLATHRFVYNKTTGDLYFDEDGVGGVAAVKIATLDNLFGLTAANIEIL